MQPLKITKGGTVQKGQNSMQVLRALAQQHNHLVTAGITELTNNSGGTAGTVASVAAFVNAANSGTNLAKETESEAALATVNDAIGELLATANATAAALGIAEITDSSGGTSPDGTIAAVTVATVAAATGIQATETNVIRAQFNEAFYNIGVLVNKLCEATGVTPVTLGYSGTLTDTIAAITTSATGTAADPGITKVALDAGLVVWRTSVKTLASKLIEINTAADPLVLPI